MIEKWIIYTGSDGDFHMCHPNDLDMVVGETEKDFINRIVKKDVPEDATNVALIPFNFKCPPRKHRKAWKWNIFTKSIELDKDKTKVSILDDCRKTRDRLLNESDKDKARIDDIGTNVDKTQLATYRQKLRDLPDVVESEISKLTIDKLAIYEPSYPVKP